MKKLILDLLPNEEVDLNVHTIYFAKVVFVDGVHIAAIRGVKTKGDDVFVMDNSDSPKWLKLSDADLLLFGHVLHERIKKSLKK